MGSYPHIHNISKKKKKQKEKRYDGGFAAPTAQEGTYKGTENTEGKKGELRILTLRRKEFPKHCILA